MLCIASRVSAQSGKGHYQPTTQIYSTKSCSLLAVLKGTLNADNLSPNVRMMSDMPDFRAMHIEKNHISILMHGGGEGGDTYRLPRYQLLLWL